MPDSYAKRQAAFFAEIGRECVSPADSFVDFCPVSVITTATFAELSLARSESRFDPRRFRMNVIVEPTAAGFVENAWVGCQLALGGHVRLAIIIPDPRCVMMTLPQGDLPRDPDILRTVSKTNSLRVGKGGLLPCAGVYATVAHPGSIRIGDSVLLTHR